MALAIVLHSAHDMYLFMQSFIVIISINITVLFAGMEVQYVNLTSEVYAISSPNYPSDYDNDLDYTWILHGSASHNILITIVDFHTERNYDFVHIGTHEDPTLYTFTDEVSPIEFTIDSEEIHIRFTSDVSVTTRGFRLEVSLVNFTIDRTCPETQVLCHSQFECVEMVDVLCNGVKECEFIGYQDEYSDMCSMYIYVLNLTQI